MGPAAKREAWMFYLLASPWILGFIVFTAGPMIASAYLSLTRWDLFGSPQFIGLDNFRKLLEDPLVRQSLKVTLTYAAMSLPLSLLGSMLLAMLLNQAVRGMRWFRTIFYLPSVVSGVAVLVLWMWIFNPEMGLANRMLALIGIQGPKWLADPNWALPSMVVMSLWGIGGGMVIYLAGLQGIPRHLYEAAEIDGASGWRQFWHITLPMLSPTIFFNLVMGIIGTFQTFGQAYVMTQGGPANSTLFYGYYLYKTAFMDFKMGYASALAWLLFVIIMALTMLVIRSSSAWVYYEGEVK